jgi:hypothetical protein
MTDRQSPNCKNFRDAHESPAQCNWSHVFPNDILASSIPAAIDLIVPHGDRLLCVWEG